MMKVGWNIRVIAGKDSGKEGIIIRVLKKSNQVVVKDINVQIKHVKKTQEKAGERIQFEAPLDASNVMLIDSEGAVTRVGARKGENGKNVYFEKTTGKEIKETFKK